MRVMAVVASGVLLVALAGCTAAAAPKPTPSSPTTIALEGTAAGQRTVRVPAGSGSATISIGCEGSFLSVTVDQEQNSRLAHCDAEREVTVPLHGESLALQIDGYGMARYTLVVRFSRAPFRSDPTTTAQCRAAGNALSDITSAMNGVRLGQLDAAGARQLMLHAAAQLQGVPTDGQLGDDLYDLCSRILANPGADPNGLLPLNPTQACADNESPIAVLSQYGG
jgi:hypothetical protein